MALLGKKVQCKSISLETKMQFIRMVEVGRMKKEVANLLGLAQATLKTILNQTEKAKASMQQSSDLTNTKLTHT